MSREIGYSGDADIDATVESGWADNLDADERIMWEGRPVGGCRPTIASLGLSIFGMFFAAIALSAMLDGIKAGGWSWMIALPHFSVGVGVMIGPHFWKWHTLRRSWYTLTDRRGIIATDRILQGRRLKSYPIDETTNLDYRPGNPASVYFAKVEKRGNKGRRYTVDVGFDRIADGEAVYKLIRKIQRDAA